MCVRLVLQTHLEFYLYFFRLCTFSSILSLLPSLVLYLASHPLSISVWFRSNVPTSPVFWLHLTLLLVFSCMRRSYSLTWSKLSPVGKGVKIHVIFHTKCIKGKPLNKPPFKCFFLFGTCTKCSVTVLLTHRATRLSRQPLVCDQPKECPLCSEIRQTLYIYENAFPGFHFFSPL